MHPYSYRAYGLRIQSNSIIPGLYPDPAESAPFDVLLEISSKPPAWFCDSQLLDSTFRYKQSAVPETTDPAYALIVWGAEQFFELAYSDGARFIIDATAGRVWCKCPPLSIDDIGVYLRGPIMGFVLRRRHVASLHACAASIGGKSVVLCGPTESGKSTTAAALALRDVPILCDDITALSEVGDKFYAEPGYPRICLWRDVAQYLLGTPDALPSLTPTWEKCFLPLDGVKAKFEEKRLPLTIVYLLAPRVSDPRAPWIEDLGRRQSLLELVQNTYMNWLLDRERRASEFDILTRLVTDVRVRKIVPHADPHRINALCELICSDAERVSAAALCPEKVAHNP